MTVSEFMSKSGIPIHLKGYKYIEMAVTKLIDRDVHSTNIIALYGEIAAEIQCSATSMNRNIGTAIQVSYPFCDNSIKELFKNHSKVPCSGEYLKTVAYAIQKGMI